MRAEALRLLQLPEASIRAAVMKWPNTWTCLTGAQQRVWAPMLLLQIAMLATCMG